jgi:hypothetical protein
MSEKTAVLDTFNIVFREFINDIAEVFPKIRKYRCQEDARAVNMPLEPLLKYGITQFRSTGKV